MLGSSRRSTVVNNNEYDQTNVEAAFTFSECKTRGESNRALTGNQPDAMASNIGAGRGAAAAPSDETKKPKKLTNTMTNGECACACDGAALN